ncbi:hypothetical protein V7S43_006051 [Phytophthora oleae]|uniref:Uncharacterized protein n=1 Tax=Phytophthora oleae TaxID=2107226 RepID=A0ABD3FST9_9STRA
MSTTVSNVQLPEHLPAQATQRQYQHLRPPTSIQRIELGQSVNEHRGGSTALVHSFLRHANGSKGSSQIPQALDAKEHRLPLGEAQAINLQVNAVEGKILRRQELHLDMAIRPTIWTSHHLICLTPSANTDPKFGNSLNLRLNLSSGT